MELGPRLVREATRAEPEPEDVANRKGPKARSGTRRPSKDRGDNGRSRSPWCVFWAVLNDVTICIFRVLLSKFLQTRKWVNDNDVNI